MRSRRSGARRRSEEALRRQLAAGPRDPQSSRIKKCMSSSIRGLTLRGGGPPPGEFDGPFHKLMGGLVGARMAQSIMLCGDLRSPAWSLPRPLVPPVALKALAWVTAAAGPATRYKRGALLPRMGTEHSRSSAAGRAVARPRLGPVALALLRRLVAAYIRCMPPFARARAPAASRLVAGPVAPPRGPSRDARRALRLRACCSSAQMYR